MKQAGVFLKKNKSFAVFAALALAIVAVAVFAPWIAPYDPYEAVMTDAVQAPSAAHWFGTDNWGICFPE